MRKATCAEEGMATETVQDSSETSELLPSGPGIEKAKKCRRLRHKRGTCLSLAWDGGWSKSCVEGTQTVPSQPCPQMPRPFTDPGEGEGGEGEGGCGVTLSSQSAQGS